MTVGTFESWGAELAALSAAGHPFFMPRWRATIVGMVLDAGVDWAEVAELVTESYCVLAPKLPGRPDRPTHRVTATLAGGRTVAGAF